METPLQVWGSGLGMLGPRAACGGTWGLKPLPVSSALRSACSLSCLSVVCVPLLQRNPCLGRELPLALWWICPPCRCPVPSRRAGRLWLSLSCGREPRGAAKSEGRAASLRSRWGCSQLASHAALPSCMARSCLSTGGSPTPRPATVTLLLGQDGWVEHVDNGIRYTFDVTKCMFSPGNITEKLRVASLPCSGEVLVDLYAGIGYFTLPYLVHAAAAFAHACEWNGHAVEALRRNLALNGVRDRCHIHHGDSRQLELRDVADRVNLGLIPSSEEGWPVACRVLKKDTGGVLHIHHNVETLPTPAPPQLRAERGSPETQHPTEDHGKGTPGVRIRPEWQRWAEAAAARIQGLLAELHGQLWHTSILHIQAVKSYAPHVHHLVLDLECRPMPPA
uniref:tRNA(Phe) (4-demethylwyosine(37)-C(7)) aminocarboxypropyltransferase n=1 Tax=Bubo bubo TaxID=30461 RepID=A0A8C0EM93_BUBBB